MDSARFGDVELTYQLREGGERVVLVHASAFVSWYDPRSSRSSLRWRRPSESARWHCSTRCPWDQFKSWVPTIVGLLGAPSRVIIASTVLTTIGGILAAIIIGPAMDKTNPFRTLGIVYLGGAAFVAALGWVIGGGSTWALLGTAFLTGTCVTGGQMSVIALATVLYPPGAVHRSRLGPRDRAPRWNRRPVDRRVCPRRRLPPTRLLLRAGGGSSRGEYQRSDARTTLSRLRHA